MSAGRRIPSLDGLRAVSIALVLFAHLGGTSGFPFSLESARVDMGALGVRVFFVISGFLITTLLRSELEREGTISLRGFYWRRSVRILPPFFLYFAVVLILDSREVIELPPSDVLHAATYTMNYHWPRGWYLGHLWSLSIEEQFYLIWPIVMRLGQAPARKLALCCFLLAPLWRVGLAIARPDLRATLGENATDALAIGCLLCLFREELWKCDRYRQLIGSRALVWLLPLVIWLPFLTQRWSHGIYWGAGMSLQNLAIMVAIDATTRNPGTLAGRALNSPGPVTIGLWSYSLYLWQQLFLNRAGSALVQAFPLNLACAVACAWASYRYVERPALQLRSRLPAVAR